ILEIIIVGVYAEGLDEKWLGRKLDEQTIQELINKKILSPVGEGGEFETLVLNAPFFKKRLEVQETARQWDGTRGQIDFKALTTH
ncbi:TIGR00289 family protein, partial [archaeon]|nr:TIGR00289 family protein [archaeon]